MAPWHTSDLADAKHVLRRAERRWRRCGLIVHRQIYFLQILRELY